MKTATPQQCNVLSLSGAGRRLWRFSTSRNSVSLSSELNGSPGDALPSRLVSKGWGALIETKLNIAWLPAGQVFLRVAQLPKCGFDELTAMVELQLEKLSPLPVAQILWSVEVIPPQSVAPTDLQTVAIVIAARSAVEAFLGELESKNFRADSLEAPFLHQLQAAKIEGDGAWLYPQEENGATRCLIAWWYSGVLQHLSLAHLTAPENWSSEIGAHLTKTAWAGEMEGWMTSAPKYHLVAEGRLAAEWQTRLAEFAGGSVDLLKPMDPGALATASARRAARSESKVNLLPPEFAARYRQEFIDRIWMGGVFSTFVVYLIVVGAFFAALQFKLLKKHELETKVSSLSGDYTNALMTEARIKVLQDKITFKNAALDCWKAVADNLPSEMTLVDFSFARGKVTYRGTATTGSEPKVTEFDDELGKAEVNGTRLFSKVSAPNITTTGGQVNWNIICDLKGVEE